MERLFSDWPKPTYAAQEHPRSINRYGILKNLRLLRIKAGFGISISKSRIFRIFFLRKILKPNLKKSKSLWIFFEHSLKNPKGAGFSQKFPGTWNSREWDFVVLNFPRSHHSLRKLLKIKRELFLRHFSFRTYSRVAEMAQIHQIWRSI